MGPNFDIQYRNRISNRVVDALSSIPEQVECSMLAIPQWQHWNTLQIKLIEDEYLKKLREHINSGNNHVRFIVEQEILYHKSRVVIPQFKLMANLISQFHNSLTSVTNLISILQQSCTGLACARILSNLCKIAPFTSIWPLHLPRCYSLFLALLRFEIKLLLISLKVYLVLKEQIG